MPKLSQLLSDIVEVVIPPDGDDPVRISVRRQFVTPSMQIRLMSVADAPQDEQARTLIEFVHLAVVSWNLTDEEGTVLGLDRESVANVPLAILAEVAQAITEAMHADAPLNGAASSAGSPPAVGTAKRRTTT